MSPCASPKVACMPRATNPSYTSLGSAFRLTLLSKRRKSCETGRPPRFDSKRARSSLTSCDTRVSTTGSLLDVGRCVSATTPPRDAFIVKPPVQAWIASSKPSSLSSSTIPKAASSSRSGRTQPTETLAWAETGRVTGVRVDEAFGGRRWSVAVRGLCKRRDCASSWIRVRGGN